MKSRKRLFSGSRLSALAVVLMLAAWAAIPASAQTTTVPDLSQFGFPNVTGTATFTPGQATTLTAGRQKVDIPADFLTKPVKFEFLEGDPSFFASNLSGDDAGKTVLATFAFRVTDTATGQLVGRFDKPVMWSITDPSVSSDSEVYNTSPANPPKITENSTPGTIQGSTLSHPFGGAGVGWLVLNPASAPSPAPAGMPQTGAGSGDLATELLMLALAAVMLVSGGLMLRSRTGQPNS